MAIRLAESLRARVWPFRARQSSKDETASHSGRLELWEGCPSFLFDGAHNPSGTRALRAYLDEFVKGPVTLVFGAMRDKNLEEMAANLFPVASLLVLTQPDNPRAASVELLQEVVPTFVDPERIIATRSVENAIRKAMENTVGWGCLLCGTLLFDWRAHPLSGNGGGGTFRKNNKGSQRGWRWADPAKILSTKPLGSQTNRS